MSEPANEDGGFVSVRQQRRQTDGDKWGSVSYCLANIPCRSHAFSAERTYAHPPTPNATNPAPCYSSKTVAAAQNILIAAQLLLLSTGLSYTGVYRNTYLSVVSCLFVLCNTSQVAGIRGGKTAMQDGHFDRQSNRQFRDG